MQETVIDLRHYIEDQRILDVTINIIQEHSTVEKIEYAEKVIDNILALLSKDNLLNEAIPQKFVDILKASAYLHNIFFNGSITSLFKAREVLTEELAATLSKEEYESILQTIEGQLGEGTPVPLLKPTKNSPTDTFALAVWITKNYEPITQ